MHMKYFYVYKVTNTINGKFYIGKRASTVEPHQDVRYLGSGKLIMQAVKKFGKDSFSKEIIAILESEEACFAMERELVTEDILKDPDCYNLCVGGRGRIGPMKNLSEESRKRMGDSRRGKSLSEKQRQTLSESHKGKIHTKGWHHTETAKAKMSEAKLGKCLSEEHKEKLSQNSARKGKLLSQEMKDQISKKLKGQQKRKHTPEERAKNSERNLGKKLSEETKRKMSESRKGKPASEFARQRAREGWILRKKRTEMQVSSNMDTINPDNNQGDA